MALPGRGAARLVLEFQATCSEERGSPTDAITIINESRDKVRVALFKQPSSAGEPAVALGLAEVGVHGRARVAPPEETAPADLRLAIVRSTRIGDALPSWAVHEAVSIQTGQTAKVRGSLSRGYEIRVK
ncbi:MAG TPA: hypothetical protein VGG03_14210 [Thermoanaerobaculia bacterium]